MMKTIVRKLLYLAAVLFGVSVLSFALLQLSGRDAATAIALRTLDSSAENIERIRTEMGLDGTPAERYGKWLGSFLTGDLGYSTYSGHAVAEDIAANTPITAALMGLAMMWVILLGTPAALYCAYRPNRLFDHIARGITIIGICLPTFWVGYVLLVIFAVRLQLVTVTPQPGIAGLILPSLALSLPSLCSFIRVFRSSLLKEMGAEYCLIAKTRGLSRGRILLRHSLRNALPPAVTLLMQYVGYLFVGTVLVESVFSISGLGSYLLSCALASDSSALAACLMLSAAVYAVFNLVGELINRLLCPKSRRITV